MSEPRVPVLSAQALGRLHATIWAACVATYLGLLLPALAAGADDLFAVGRATVGTLAVAIGGRVLEDLLASARRPATPPRAPAQEPGEALGLASTSVPDTHPTAAIPPVDPPAVPLSTRSGVRSE